MCKSRNAITMSSAKLQLLLADVVTFVSRLLTLSELRVKIWLQLSECKFFTFESSGGSEFHFNLDIFDFLPICTLKYVVRVHLLLLLSCLLLAQICSELKHWYLILTQFYFHSTYCLNVLCYMKCSSSLELQSTVYEITYKNSLQHKKVKFQEEPALEIITF